MKNYSEFIKCPKQRILTSKGYKFQSRCIEIACANKGYTRYHSQVKDLKEQLSALITHLFIDKGLTSKEIAEIIKNRVVNNGLNETI